MADVAVHFVHSLVVISLSRVNNNDKEKKENIHWCDGGCGRSFVSVIRSLVISLSRVNLKKFKKNILEHERTLHRAHWVWWALLKCDGAVDVFGRRSDVGM